MAHHKSALSGDGSLINRAYRLPTRHPYRLAFFKYPLEAFLISTGIVALAEIGDKTQLLAFMLAAKFRRPWPIIGGILVATLANHALAGALGAWITAMVAPQTMRWVLGIGFIAMAIWTLIPDKLHEGAQGDGKLARYGVFSTTVIAFFLAEMGDKTQVATVALAAQFNALFAVVAGTTLVLSAVAVCGVSGANS